MSKKISILGCGWLGFPLGQYLAVRGYTVKGSTTTPAKLDTLHQHKIIPFLIEVGKMVKGNNLPLFFQSEILVLNIPPGRRRKDVGRSYPRRITAILEKAEQYGIQKILFISSTSVYGNVNRIVTEADEPQPETESGKAIVTVEELLQANKGFETTILRMGGLVGGNRQAGRFLAGKKGLKNANAPVNLIHQQDCIRIITAIIEQECWGEIFNACTDDHPSKREFYTFQAKKQGLEPPEFLNEIEMSFKEVSNYKLKRTLNYEFLNPNPMKF